MVERTFRKPSSEILKSLAENVREFRRAKKLSQEGLADVCGFHRTYIGSIERGERNVTLSTLETLAVALEVGIPDLLRPASESKKNEDTQ